MMIARQTKRAYSETTTKFSSLDHDMCTMVPPLA